MKLEQEQGKLLETNVELAIDQKKLLILQKGWKQEKADLMAANAEFAEEVDKLYKMEERWEGERLEARREAEEARRGLEEELGELGMEVQRERSRWEEELKVLREDQANRVEEGLKEEEKNELQATLDTLKEQVEEERVRRREAEEMATSLSKELEGEEKELMEVKAAFVELSKKYTENEELARLKAENFENTIENEDLKAKLAASEEQSEKTNKELEKVRSEKKRLEQSVKSEKEQEGVRRREKEETEATRLELRKEKEKVSGISAACGGFNWFAVVKEM